MLRKFKQNSQSRVGSILSGQIPISSRAINNKHLFDFTEEKGILENERKKMLDLTANLKSNTGLLKMNREHRMNLLTPRFVKQVSRGVKSFYLDEQVRLIYLTSQKGDHFSCGTDFKTMLHYKANREVDKLTSYIEDIFQLQATFAKVNKPILTIAPGNSFNSAAGLLIASGMPAICDNSVLAFNECSLGFVPHAGATYYASRLPGDFGTFLLLTGIPFSGQDAINLNLADKYIIEPETFDSLLRDYMINFNFGEQPTHAEMLGLFNRNYEHNHRPINEWGTRKSVIEDNFNIQKYYYNYQENNPLIQKAPSRYFDYIHLKNLETERRRRWGGSSDIEIFKDPLERRPDLVGDADVEYEKMLKYDTLVHSGRGKPGYFDHKAKSLGVFNQVWDFLDEKIDHHYTSHFPKSLLNHRQMIDRCFWHNTVEEIMESLKRETHPFATEILQRMEANSMLSMKIALKMLRKAKNMDYGQILRMEHNVALNKVRDSDFDLGVKQVIGKPLRTVEQVAPGIRFNPGFLKDISDNQVEAYFQPHPAAGLTDFDIVENCLYPTRHFFQLFPDSLRVYLNEHASPDPSVRMAVDYEVEDILRTEGLDMKNKTFSVPMAREVIFKKHRFSEYLDEMNTRGKQLMTDHKLRKWYIEQIEKEIEIFERQRVVFIEKINAKVKKIFEDAFFDRLGMIFDKCKEAQSLQKRRLFIKLKKFLIKQRVVLFITEETNKIHQQIQSLPFKDVHLTERWDQSFREMDHPEAKQSFLWHLSRVIGRANLAPIEMMKSFVTNPEAAKAFQPFVFDKEELKKLRDDLINNPEKYQEMLLKQEKPDKFFQEQDQGGWRHFFQLKMQKREYWTRYYNNGYFQRINDHPFKVEFYKYKEWMDSIQSKALNTLKLIVNRLILDFEDDKVNMGNSVQEFSQKQKESKREALSRLVKMLNKDEENISIPNQPKESILLQKESNQSDSEFIAGTILTNLIQSDQHLKKIFGDNSDISFANNATIQSLREELLGLLYQLLETLIMGRQYQLNDYLFADTYEKRLLELTTSSHINSQSSIKIIDKFLQQSNAQNQLSQMLDIVKPYFLMMVQDRLQTEMDKVYQAFYTNDVSSKALQIYLLNLSNRKFLDYAPFLSENLQVLTALRQQRIKDMINPEQAEFNRKKLMLERYGKGNIDASDLVNSDGLSAGQIIENQEANTRDTASEWVAYQNLVSQKKALLKASVEKSNEVKMRKPVLDGNDFIQDNIELDKIDQHDIDEYIFKLEEIDKFIRTHEYELKNQLSVRDWMKIMADLVKKYKINLDSLIKTERDPRLSRDEYSDSFRPIARAYKLFFNNEIIQMDQILLDESISQAEQEKLEDYFTNNSEKMITWGYIADYANYLDQLAEETQIAMSDSSSVANYEKVLQFMNQLHNSEQSARQESFFAQISEDKYQQNGCRLRDQKLVLKDIKSEKEFYKLIEDRSNTRRQCLVLAQNASGEVRQKVENMVSEDRKYFDYKKLLNKLKGNQLSTIDFGEFIDQEHLLSDFQRGKVLGNFMERFGDIKLDVVSLAETRELIANAASTQDDQAHTVSQIKMILDHVDNQLKFVDNQRRQAISLRDFITKDHFLSPNSTKELSNEMLKNQIESLIGSKGSSEEIREMSLDGTLTTPARSKRLLEREDENVENELKLASMKMSQKKEKGFAVTDPELGTTTLRGENETVERAVYRDALRLTELSKNMKNLRNLTENKLIAEYLKENYDQIEVEKLIHDYMFIRMKECLLNPHFAQGIRSVNGHIYQKALRERVLDELKLSEYINIEDINWQGIPKDEKDDLQIMRVYFPDQKYSLNSLNNLDAIGYNRLEERAADIANNRDIAHDSAFDKLLADFFLYQRSQHNIAHSLHDKLENDFEQDKFNDLNQVNQQMTLGGKFLIHQVGKKEKPEMLPQNFSALMDLDKTINKYLYNEKSFIKTELQRIPDDDLTIPQYFEELDVRKPADKYVIDKLHKILESIFNCRRKVEKTLSRGELIAYDHVIAKMLDPQVLLGKLRFDIYQDMNLIDQAGQVVLSAQDRIKSDDAQYMKAYNNQDEILSRTKDFDAYYKMIAFSQMRYMHKTQKSELSKNKELAHEILSVTNFDRFYLDDLENRGFKEPSEIDETIFTPKKKDRDLKKYKGHLEQAEEFFDDYNHYLEQKKQQKDRKDTFTILSQMFEAQRRNPETDPSDPLFKAQEHIRDYFKDPANFDFYDKSI